jgi:uncharacterized protein (DUF608 family)
MTTSQTWPVLRRYDSEHLNRIALPLGGIGTGTVSLGGRGDLRDWEIMNRPAKGFIPPGVEGVVPWGAEGMGPLFALYAKSKGGSAIGRLLEGPLPLEDYEGWNGAATPNHGFPRFRHCEFAQAYPLGQVLLSDPRVPVTVRLEAFNPLVPGDTDASSIPVAVLRYVLTNRTGKRVEAAVGGMLPNFIGNDGTTNQPRQPGTKKFRAGKGLHGIFMSANGLDPKASQWGTLALSVLGQRDSAVTYQTNWADKKWGEPFLDFWEDFTSDGRLVEHAKVTRPDPKASLAASFVIPAHGTKSVTFLITWHFPNRPIWFPPDPKLYDGKPCATDPASVVGNYYTTQYRDAWDVAQQLATRLPKLEADTVEFVRAFCDSDLPLEVKDAALCTLTALRTQTTFRTANGLPYGWEGCQDREGCCQGSCNHVWNYENAVGFLFGDFARGMRQVEFQHALMETGLMCFRVGLPVARSQEWPTAAADGQMGAIVRFYRDWKLSGDEQFLQSLWPRVRKAIEFCWIPGGWDADKDGVMEGCQHNTMDVEYYGPNPQMGLWYLAALRACEEMARHLGDEEFALTCHSLYERGRAWIDANLFNGEYYEHQIWPPKVPPAKGLRLRWEEKFTGPEFQLGAGCLVDQLAGQYMAHATGLGYLIDPAHARTALRSVMKYNFKPDFADHFSHMRSFVLNGESALLMATYPRGNRPESSFPYWTEVMTGFEYCAAVGMIYEGQTAEGLKCIKAVRDRYDGRKRSPFNEAECGHHYARAMASWTAVLALSGFQYSALDQTMRFAAKSGKWFWSNGSAWGTCKINKRRIELTVLHGAVTLQHLEITGQGRAKIGRTLRQGQRVALTIPKS